MKFRTTLENATQKDRNNVSAQSRNLSRASRHERSFGNSAFLYAIDRSFASIYEASRVPLTRRSSHDFWKNRPSPISQNSGDNVRPVFFALSRNRFHSLQRSTGSNRVPEGARALKAIFPDRGKHNCSHDENHCGTSNDSHDSEGHRVPDSET